MVVAFLYDTSSLSGLSWGSRWAPFMGMKWGTDARDEAFVIGGFTAVNYK
jgi:hypothetical protein